MPQRPESSPERSNAPVWVADAVAAGTVPGQAELPGGIRGTGEPISWGEPRRRWSWSAGSFSASPSANPAGRRKRSMSFFPRALAPIFIALLCVIVPTGALAQSPTGGTSFQEEPPPPVMQEPGAWTGPEVPGDVAVLQEDGTA